MATGGEEQVDYSLVKVGRLTLEDTDKSPWHTSIVVSQEKIVVIDSYAWKVEIYRIHDGKCLATTDRLESRPRDMCLMDAMTICVLHVNGLIKMMSIDSTDMLRDLKTNRTLRLQGVLDDYHGVVRFKDNLVVSGEKQGRMYWCIVSPDVGHVDTIHKICKGDDGWCRVTTKDNIVYISCYAGDEAPDNNGVYGFDILNLKKCKYTYKHQRLQEPRSIVINEDGNIFVCNGIPDDSIHQLTASCQLVAIFTREIPRNSYAIFLDHGRLYVTGCESSDITVFQPMYQVGSHSEIEQGNVDKGQTDVKTEMLPSGPSSEESEDEKKTDHKASEVQLSDERKQPVSEETSTQMAQTIPIHQRVEETLEQATIQMSTEEKDMFLKFQREIGTTLYFSADQESLIDAKKNVKTTESFLKKHKPDVVDKWLEYRDQGKLTPELIDVIYAEERNQELHENKDYILHKMEELNIIARARSFNENGVKEENYFFTPCVLRKKSPREVITPAKDPRMVSTSVLCWVITGKVLLPAIFQKLIAACLTRWPVAKEMETSKNLIFQDCTVFDLDLIHRLFLHCKKHAIFARIAKMGIDKVNAMICTRVRKFITINLSEIISRQDPSSNYMLCVKNAKSQDIPEDIRSRLSPPLEMWFMDEVHDPNAPITREHMNHARLCVALVTICGNAMRAILLANIPAPHTNIYQVILANKIKLTSRTQIVPGQWQNALLNKNQCKMLFPDPKQRYVAPIDQFDISLLYTLIRNVSTVKRPATDWGVTPQDRPRDKSLGSNVERIHLYRNEICGHSVDGQISQHDFEEYWNKIDAVLHDIDAVIVGHVFSLELEKQKSQVISIYEAC